MKRTMEGVLWYMLAGSRGGPNRIRIVQSLDERPRNANQLAEDLDLDYTTIRHHLDVLLDHGVVEQAGGDYGTIYILTDRVNDHWSVIEEITEVVDQE